LNVSRSAFHKLEQLAELYDEEFVAAAYGAILGRPPDVGGLKNYLSQVRGGTNKLHILLELALSAEGRSRSPPALGLDEFIKKHSVRPRSFWSRLRRPQEELVLSLERQIRAMDNHLYLFQRDLTKRMTEVTESIRLMPPKTVSVSDSSPNGGANEVSAALNSPLEARVLPKLGKTFGDIMQAISARQ